MNNFNGTFQSIRNSAKKVNTIQQALNGIQSESGWERLKTATKMFLGGK